MRLLTWLGLLLGIGMLLGCYPKGDPAKPVPQVLVPAAQQQARRLVVVLPGRGDSLRGLQRSGIAATIHQRWPDTDVILTGLNLGYYMAGNAERRLHDGVVLPAREHGYREIWLLGVSLGGMGAILYDRAYPGQIHGMILLSPYLGEKPLWQEITDAGGIARWQPGPEPAKMDKDNFQHELWRHIHDWSLEPGSTSNIWLGYGDEDSLRPGIDLLAPALPPGQVFLLHGGHNWGFWLPTAGRILEQAETENRPDKKSTGSTSHPISGNATASASVTAE